MARQWSAVKMLEHLSTFRNTLNSVDAADMGRAAGKVEGFEESLGARSRALASLQLSAKSNYSGGHRHADGDLMKPLLVCIVARLWAKWTCARTLLQGR